MTKYKLNYHWIILAIGILVVASALGFGRKEIILSLNGAFYLAALLSCMGGGVSLLIAISRKVKTKINNNQKVLEDFSIFC
ncbi:MAG: hypothetical protein AB1420_06540 [Bacillota bacterium]